MWEYIVRPCKQKKNTGKSDERDKNKPHGGAALPAFILRVGMVTNNMNQR
jgi:hypothetical protein